MKPKHKLLIHTKSIGASRNPVAIKLQNLAEFKQNADCIMVETKYQISDGELVLKIAGYNAQAFEELFKRYSPFLLGLIKKIIGDQGLSEQILLNVFAIFWKRIDNYDTTTNNVFTFFSMLTRNRAVDVLNRMDEHKLSPIYDDNYETEKILPKLSPVIKPITLEIALAFGERIRFYKSQLTEVQNLVLNMVFFEGLTDEEIAKKLNIPVATVKQKIQTTLGALMQNLSGKNPEAFGNKKLIELIKLEAIGRLSPDENEYLTIQKNDDPEFPWQILGEYQNLVALLSSVVTPENPPTYLSKEIKSLFSNVLIGKTELYNVIIPNKSNPPSVKEVKQEESVPEASTEEFPIRFKEPNKEELAIIEEISQITPEQVSTEESNKKSSSVIKEPVVIENKISANLPVEEKHNVVPAVNKTETGHKKLENKTATTIQDKLPNMNRTETATTAINIEQKTIDSVSINKKLNQILSKTEAIKEKNKLEEAKRTSQEKIADPPKEQEKQVNKINAPKSTLTGKDSDKKQEESTPVKDINKVLAKADQAVSKEEKPKTDSNKSAEIKSSDYNNKTAETRLEKKSEEENPQIEKLIEDYKQTYEKEIGTLQKKLRRNIMITVGLVILLLGGAAAIFLSMQKETSRLITKVDKPVDTESQPLSTVVGNENIQAQQNIVQTQTEQQNLQPQVTDLKTQQNLNQQTSQQKTEQIKKEEQKNIYPQLPEAPKIIESTVNGESNKNSNNDKKGNDIVSNRTEKKTEEIIPPKEDKPITEEPAFFVAVEEPPQPVGGLANIQKKIVYPEIAKRLGIEGKVLIQAIIDENGNVAKAKVIKGIGSGCDEVALDAVKSSKFTPGKQRGKNVRVQITIPIVFKL